ncbi:MAG: hypothetical protein ACKOJF_27325, partial [Planctomycetaceae bacterium]
WNVIPREAVLHDQIDPGAAKLPARRVVFLSDAGGGKSAALEWLALKWNRPGSRRIAVNISAELFLRQPLRDCGTVLIHELLLDKLAEICTSRVINTTDSTDQQRLRVPAD